MPLEGKSSHFTQHALTCYVFQDGMQKEIFTKFITKLEKNCRSVLVGCETDYRHVIAHSNFDKEHFFWPLDSQSRSKFERRWQDLTNQRGFVITLDELATVQNDVYGQQTIS